MVKKLLKSHGFTFVEMAIILAIMGFIILAIVPLYTVITKKQKILETKSELQNIKEALITYYKDHFRLPPPVTEGSYRYVVPAGELGLPPEAKYDPIKGVRYLYFVTNNGSPVPQIEVDSVSIGSTAGVIISAGFNGTFDEENRTPADGRFNQTGPGKFDDILIYISETELKAATSYLREIYEDVAILNQAAQVLAANDDDADGFVDEDPAGSTCGAADPPGNCDGLENWSQLNSHGIEALTNAGLITDAEHLVDPWGTTYIWNSSTHRFYSAGPNRHDDGCTGDDICP